MSPQHQSSSPSIPSEPAWLTALSNDTEYEYSANRPWAAGKHRVDSGCIGNDYVLSSNRIIFKFYWHERSKVLHGAVLFTIDAEGPPKGQCQGHDETTISFE